MAGIKSFGIYLPLWRLSLNLISPGFKGERTVAAIDEDSVTMAVSASQECLRGLDRKIVDGLIFSSTTSPFAEKQLASLIALAIDLRPDIFTLDIGGSLKAGTGGLKWLSIQSKRGEPRMYWWWLRTAERHHLVVHWRCL
jgi:3-hydroxy-3-methylglutaryl CoA synthase